jgi:hypothetical protein
MKKLTIIYGVFLVASVVLTSCGSELESDIEKACELKCVMEESTTTRTVEEAKAAATEFHDFRKELGSKYDHNQLVELNKYMFEDCDCK